MGAVDRKPSSTRRRSNALTHVNNNERRFCARERREYLRGSFRAFRGKLLFPSLECLDASLSLIAVTSPSARPRPSLSSRSLFLFFSLEFANPYLAPHSLTTNFVNGFHSGGFSRSSCSPAPRSSFPQPLHSRQAASCCLSSALFARLSNCHFLRQIVLSRVGVTDTRIKLGPKKRGGG